MAPRKTKAEAALDLIVEARAERGSVTRMKRTLRACAVLGLSEDETAHIMKYLDYWNEDDEPYEIYRGQAPTQ